MSDPASRDRLIDIFSAGVRAADPARLVSSCIETTPAGLQIAGESLPVGARISVLATGKAALSMAGAAHDALGARVERALVVSPDGGGSLPAPFEKIAGDHPLPGPRSVQAGQAVVRFARKTGRDETLLVLLSGGTSSLTSTPVVGISAGEVAETTELLLHSGASIRELNAVRKHLLAAAGGRLTDTCPAARIVVLVLSDVLADRIDVIGSGPFAPDPSTFSEAWGVLATLDLLDSVPSTVRRHLDAGCQGARPETPTEDTPGFERVVHYVIGNNRTALDGAVRRAQTLGFRPVIVSDALEGEAREVGHRLAALAAATSVPDVCLLAGGETTVTVTGGGRGGRNLELALAAAIALDGTASTLLAAGTDGVDGTGKAAGAVVDGTTLARGRAAGVDALACLESNDASAFFERAGGLVAPGPTGTNVLDLVAIEPRSRDSMG